MGKSKQGTSRLADGNDKTKQRSSLPRDPETLCRAHGALHRFAEWLELELAGAVQAARSRQLAPLRGVLQTCHFLHQRYALDDHVQSVSRPTELIVEAELPIGLRQCDAVAMEAYIEEFDECIEALGPYEGQPFSRKAINLGTQPIKAGVEGTSSMAGDVEKAALGALDGLVVSLTMLFHVAIASLAEQAHLAPVPPKTKTEGNPDFCTPPQLAKRLRVGPDKIHAWIQDGSLKAIDISQRRGGRPRYLISQEAIDEFTKRRQVKQPVATKRKPRKSSGEDVIEFF